MLWTLTEPIFDHVKLDVYGLELEFVAWTTDFLEEVLQSPVPHRRELLRDFEHEDEHVHEHEKHPFRNRL
jgi:hypothetical protein